MNSQNKPSSSPKTSSVQDDNGTIACCWQLTWKERLQLLATGKIWHQVLTFHGPLQPQLLTVEKPVMTQPTR